MPPPITDINFSTDDDSLGGGAWGAGGSSGLLVESSQAGVGFGATRLEIVNILAGSSLPAHDIIGYFLGSFGVVVPEFLAGFTIQYIRDNTGFNTLSINVGDPKPLQTFFHHVVIGSRTLYSADAVFTPNPTGVDWTWTPRIGFVDGSVYAIQFYLP